MIDPNKMAAYVNEGTPPEAMAPEGEGAPEEGNVDRFGPLIPLLEEFADVIEEVSDEMDADILADPEALMAPEDTDILRSGVETLDNRLKKALLAVLGAGPITGSDAEYLALHLAEEGLITDEGRIAGWLYRVGELLGEGAAPEEGAEEGEEGEAEEEPEE